MDSSPKYLVQNHREAATKADARVMLTGGALCTNNTESTSLSSPVFCSTFPDAWPFILASATLLIPKHCCAGGCLQPVPHSGQQVLRITPMLHRANTALQSRCHMCYLTLMLLDILLPSLLPWQEWCCLSTFQTPKDSRLSVASHTHSHNGSNSVGAMFSSAPYKHKAVPQ